MTENSHNTLLGRSPANYGITSLILACLVFASGFLVVVVGVALAGAVMLLLALAGVGCGLLGVGAGLYYRDSVAIVTGTLGLVLIGFIVSWFVSAVMNF